MLEDHDKLVEEIFQHEDKDKNGFISHEEFSGPKHDELWEGAYILQDISTRANYSCDLNKTILEMKKSFIEISCENLYSPSIFKSKSVLQWNT